MEKKRTNQKQLITLTTKKLKEKTKLIKKTIQSMATETEINTTEVVKSIEATMIKRKMRKRIKNQFLTTLNLEVP